MVVLTLWINEHLRTQVLTSAGHTCCPLEHHWAIDTNAIRGPSLTQLYRFLPHQFAVAWQRALALQGLAGRLQNCTTGSLVSLFSWFCISSAVPKDSLCLKQYTDAAELRKRLLLYLLLLSSCLVTTCTYPCACKDWVTHACYCAKAGANDDLLQLEHGARQAIVSTNDRRWTMTALKVLSNRLSRILSNMQ